MEQVLKKGELAVFALRKIYEQYGYTPYKMSRFEEYDLYVRNKDFLLSDRVITFSDTDGRLLALKPDVTLSIIKNAKDIPGGVQKLYYNENVYRPGKADQGFREILQAGLECVGDLSAYDIHEVVLLAMKSLEALNYPYLLDISHMGLVLSVLKRSGLEDVQQKQAAEFLRQKNSHEMQKLCESSSCECTNLLIAFTQVYGNPSSVFSRISPLLKTEEEKQYLSELTGIYKMLSDLGYGDNVQVDFSVGSDMKYYSGVVFKGYLEGLPIGILSGGAYDKLLKKMGRSGKAVGFALYLDMLERYDENTTGSAVDILLLYNSSDEANQVMQLCEKLRKTGRVLACKSIPENLKWKEKLIFKKGEAVNNGANA